MTPPLRPPVYRVVTLRPSGRPCYSTHSRRDAFRLARQAAAVTGAAAAVYVTRNGRRLRLLRRYEPRT